jgi:arylsulfatase A-like enzyme
VGKWHLSGASSTFNPETFGLDYYKGLITGTAADYYSWTMTEDGSTQTETEYITTKFTDLAIDWVKEQDKPWFLWLAYTAPHTPFHVPPTGTHSQGNLPTYVAGLNEEPYYMAAIESMDFQIGRLLDNIPQDELDNTIIIYLGDNGTPRQVAQAPYDRNKVKGSLYQGGINTPLIISGKGVSRLGTDQNLVNGTDLFATISSLAGASTSEIHDSKSIVPLLSSNTTHRDFQYSEISETTSDIWTIRNDQYKLIVMPNGTDEMYDLVADPYENVNLLTSTLSTEATTAKQSLEAELAVIRN